MLRLKADPEEDKLEEEVFRKEGFELFYPGKMVASNVEGDGGKVEGDCGLDAVKSAVEEGCEWEWRVGLGGRVDLCAGEGRHRLP